MLAGFTLLRMYKTQQRTLHKIAKQLKREVRHCAWLEKNLKGAEAVRDSRKQVLKLRTELAYKMNKS